MSSGHTLLAGSIAVGLHIEQDKKHLESIDVPEEDIRNALCDSLLNAFGATDVIFSAGVVTLRGVTKIPSQGEVQGVVELRVPLASSIWAWWQELPADDNQDTADEFKDIIDDPLEELDGEHDR
jgi:hypothetical protein